MPELPNEDEVERWFWGDVYRARHFGAYRRLDGYTGAINHATGLPESTDGLAPAAHALRGVALAASLVYETHRWCAGHLGLAAKPESEWPPDAVEAVEILELKLRRVLRRLLTKGLVRPDPKIGLGNLAADPDDPDADPDAYHPQFPVAVNATVEGVKHAEQVIRGTPLAAGPRSILADLPAEQRNQAPAYAREEFRREGGA